MKTGATVASLHISWLKKDVDGTSKQKIFQAAVSLRLKFLTKEYRGKNEKPGKNKYSAN